MPQIKIYVSDKVYVDLYTKSKEEQKEIRTKVQKFIEKEVKNENRIN